MCMCAPSKTKPKRSQGAQIFQIDNAPGEEVVVAEDVVAGLQLLLRAVEVEAHVEALQELRDGVLMPLESACACVRNRVSISTRGPHLQTL